jgi:UDP-N-acetylglucosamine diphosphorylase/glucosamine-1-phosphate N-acetyltransferase
MNYIFFETDIDRNNLLPFTFTRPVAEIRCGILTIAEKWTRHLGASVSYKTQEYLQQKFALVTAGENIMINGSVFPNEKLVEEIRALKPGEALFNGNIPVACNISQDAVATFSPDAIENTTSISSAAPLVKIGFTYDIFSMNGQAIEDDFVLVTKGRVSQTISDTNRVVNAERIFIEEGARVEFSILNASGGSIYIGKDSEIMEGCKVRGPFALCEHGGLKMDAKIYSATTVGPHCKVGGEVSNAVFFAYSNKGHDGFIGNAVIGEWCNLGADTNNSNLKNTYEEVKLWNYRTERFEKTGLTFCGLMMGDHSKCGINTMFNTGTVVGVAANIFGSGFPRNFIPSFAWGGAQGFETFILAKAYKTAEAMCARRNIVFGDADKAILKAVYDQSEKFRFWEKQA